MAAGTTATVTMTTNFGNIVIKVVANDGPNAAGAFMALVNCGYYDNIRLAFAAGATRVVVSMAIADTPDVLRECLAVAGDWLAVGLDTRPERLAAYPWHRPAPPSLVELAGELVDMGVHRLVLSQGGARPDLAFLSGLTRTLRAEIFVAGGSVDLDAIKGLRDASIAGIILGEPLLSGAIDFAKALETAA
jgi:phosphoribosylformimino-5-aminoimidazole carboxamide ribonucleotide (ProFAR) isomerase